MGLAGGQTSGGLIDYTSINYLTAYAHGALGLHANWAVAWLEARHGYGG